MRLRPMRLAGGSLAAAATVVALTVAAPAAHATDPLSGTLNCWGQGYGVFDCSATISGGVAPYTAVWSGSGIYGYDQTGETAATGRCVKDRYARATVTFYDSAGASLTLSRSFYCYSVPV